MAVAGVHLMPSLTAIGSPHPSAVAVLGDDGALAALRLVDTNEQIAREVPPETAVACVDAPLVVPDVSGQRDVERVLAWCDVPAFPVSRARMVKVYGGARGVGLAPLLAARAGRVLEAIPDLVLRELMWERERPFDLAPMDLGDYRAAWMGVRPPAYRGRAGGRAGLPGLLRAHALVAHAVDLGGWRPRDDGDDWQVIGDAARLDAILCAYAALRVADGDRALVLGTRERGAVAIPADANLRARLAVNLERLRAEGVITI